MSDVMETKTVKMVGVVRPSPEQYAAAMEGYRSQVTESVDGIPLPPRRALPIYADADGNLMVVRPGADRPTASPLPFPLPPAEADLNKGGYLPFEPGGASPSTAIAGLKAAIRDWATSLPQEVAQQMLKSTLTNLLMSGGPGNLVGGVLGALQGSVGGLLGGLGPAAGVMGNVLSSLSGGVAGSVPDVMGIVAGGCIPGQGGGADSGLGVGDALSAIGDQVMKAWKVEDSDSMGEQLAHHFANKWKDKLKDPQAALDKLKGYFTGTSAPATFAAVRVGDVDATGNPVLAGSPTVFAEGMPLARVGDQVAPPGVQVYMGAATVNTNGLMTARVTSASQAGPFQRFSNSP